MLGAVLNGPQGRLELPYGTKIEIKYVSKLGMLRTAPINVGPYRNHFYALFEEDDVDFLLSVDNSLSEDREFVFDLDVLNLEKSLIVKDSKKSSLEALETNGKKLHFVRQSTEKGQTLVSKFAKTHGITEKEAARIIGQMSFSQVGYSKVIPTFPIYVRDLEGYTLVLNVRSSMTVEKVKELIREKQGISVGHQRLIFAGRQLQDWMTIGKRGIERESTLHLALRIVGGDDSGFSSSSTSNIDWTWKQFKDEVIMSRSSERGTICFGEQSDQKYCTGVIDRDHTIKIEPFNIEMRMASRYSIE